MLGRLPTSTSRAELTHKATTQEPPAPRPDPQPVRTRRSLLAALAAVGGAIVARAFGAPEAAQAVNGDAVKVGQTVTGSFPTVVVNWSTNSDAIGFKGRTSATGAGPDTVGVLGESDAQNGTGVKGIAASSSGSFTTGVLGTAVNGRGVVGSASAAIGTTYGVLGKAYSTNGIGVQGTSTNGSTAKGVQGTSNVGIGVHGEATGNGYGVRGTGGYNGVYGNGGSYGVIGSSAGYGVYGSGDTAVYASGGTYGVQAYGSTSGAYGAASTNGVFGQGGTYGVRGDGETGVYGTSSVGSGVYGASTHPNAVAVYGTGGQYAVQGNGARTAGVRGDSGYVGVWGEGHDWGFFSIATGTDLQNYGIMAETKSATGFAGYFKGNVFVQGTLSKSAGSFRIDHPLDPDRRWLSHSFVESPDMMNVYNGTVVLDGNGAATVSLPSYFEALNRDFRYQLTPVGAAAPSLHVARKVERNEFQIAGGSAGQEISWQVTGVRQDDYANAHRIEVETAKSKADQGTRSFVAKGSGAKQMVVGPKRPADLKPAPANDTPAPDPLKVTPRAPAD